MQRRHRGEDAAGIEQRPHVPVEQRQQQAADVRAVDIGIGHHDDLAVAGGVEVEGATRPGADDLNDRSALGVTQHVADRGLLHVEDLAAQGQQRLELALARQLRGAQRRIALDDEQLSAIDVFAAAIGQLGWQ